ncbi:hypothetical protein R83H12_03046 [Fibrobacteria bacterium R8-3-H12]
MILAAVEKTHTTAHTTTATANGAICKNGACATRPYVAGIGGVKLRCRFLLYFFAYFFYLATYVEINEKIIAKAITTINAMQPIFVPGEIGLFIQFSSCLFFCFTATFCTATSFCSITLVSATLVEPQLGQLFLIARS